MAGHQAAGPSPPQHHVRFRLPSERDGEDDDDVRNVQRDSLSSQRSSGSSASTASSLSTSSRSKSSSSSSSSSLSSRRRVVRRTYATTSSASSSSSSSSSGVVGGIGGVSSTAPPTMGSPGSASGGSVLSLSISPSVSSVVSTSSRTVSTSSSSSRSHSNASSSLSSRRRIIRREDDDDDEDGGSSASSSATTSDDGEDDDGQDDDDLGGVVSVRRGVIAAQDAGSCRLDLDECWYLCTTVTSAIISPSSASSSSAGGKDDDDDRGVRDGTAVVRHTALSADAACGLAHLVSDPRRLDALRRNEAALGALLDALAAAPERPRPRRRRRKKKREVEEERGNGVPEGKKNEEGEEDFAWNGTDEENDEGRNRDGSGIGHDDDGENVGSSSSPPSRTSSSPGEAHGDYGGGGGCADAVTSAEDDDEDPERSTTYCDEHDERAALALSVVAYHLSSPPPPPSRREDERRLVDGVDGDPADAAPTAATAGMDGTRLAFLRHRGAMSSLARLVRFDGVGFDLSAKVATTVVVEDVGKRNRGAGAVVGPLKTEKLRGGADDGGADDADGATDTGRAATRTTAKEKARRRLRLGGTTTTTSDDPVVNRGRLKNGGEGAEVNDTPEGDEDAADATTGYGDQVGNVGSGRATAEADVANADADAVKREKLDVEEEGDVASSPPRKRSGEATESPSPAPSPSDPTALGRLNRKKKRRKFGRTAIMQEPKLKRRPPSEDIENSLSSSSPGGRVAKARSREDRPPEVPERKGEGEGDVESIGSKSASTFSTSTSRKRSRSPSKEGSSGAALGRGEDDCGSGKARSGDGSDATKNAVDDNEDAASNATNMGTNGKAGGGFAASPPSDPTAAGRLKRKGKKKRRRLPEEKKKGLLDTIEEDRAVVDCCSLSSLPPPPPQPPGGASASKVRKDRENDGDGDDDDEEEAGKLKGHDDDAAPPPGSISSRNSTPSGMSSLCSGGSRGSRRLDFSPSSQGSGGTAAPILRRPNRRGTRKRRAVNVAVAAATGTSAGAAGAESVHPSSSSSTAAAPREKLARAIRELRRPPGGGGRTKTTATKGSLNTHPGPADDDDDGRPSLRLCPSHVDVAVGAEGVSIRRGRNDDLDVDLSAGRLALLTLRRIVTGRDGDDEDDGDAEKENYGGHHHPELLVGTGTPDRDDEGGDDGEGVVEEGRQQQEDPLLLANSSLRESGSLAHLSLALQEAASAVVSTFGDERDGGDNGDGEVVEVGGEGGAIVTSGRRRRPPRRKYHASTCEACSRSLRSRFAILASVVDGACCLSPENQRAICSYAGGSDDDEGDIDGMNGDDGSITLVDSLTRLIAAFLRRGTATAASSALPRGSMSPKGPPSPLKKKKIPNGNVFPGDDVMLTSLHVLTSLGHENPLAGNQLCRPRRWCSPSYIFPPEKVKPSSDGKTGGNDRDARRVRPRPNGKDGTSESSTSSKPSLSSSGVSLILDLLRRTARMSPPSSSSAAETAAAHPRNALGGGCGACSGSGEEKVRYDTCVFCLNILTNTVETSPGMARREILTKTFVVAATSPRRKGSSPFLSPARRAAVANRTETRALSWLSAWIVGQTGSFRDMLMRGSFGKKTMAGEDSSTAGRNTGPTIGNGNNGEEGSHEEKGDDHLSREEEEALVTAGNGCVLLAWLMKETACPRAASVHEANAEEDRSSIITENIRRLILKEMPVDGDGRRNVSFIVRTLKAFVNFYHYSLGALSVAVIHPVVKLIAELERIPPI